jgi:hypothetical protein
MKLDVKAFALTCAVIWGVALPLATWWIMAFDGEYRPHVARPPLPGL